MDRHQLAQFNVFHHVLSRARWLPLQTSRVLFLLLVRTFIPAGAPIQLVVDETLERRWGHILANVASIMIRCAPLSVRLMEPISLSTFT
jgi:hypothetical protein